MSPRKTMLAASIAALLGAAPAHATTEIGYVWSLSAYPESFSDNAAADHSGFFCVLCHKTEAGSQYNPYGDAMRPLIGGGATQEDIIAAFRAIEAANSDGDPGGFTNIAEINAGAQPGWKDGDAVPQPVVGNLLDPVLVAPEIEVGPLAIDYGAVVLGTSATGTEVTITNQGSGDLTVSGLAFDGDPVFGLGQLTPATPFVVAAGASQKIGVVYTPDYEGQDFGALTIESDDADEPAVTVALQGTGVVATADCYPSAVPSPLVFGQVLIGASLELPVTVTNFGIGTCALDVSVPICEGEFALTSAPSVSIGAGESAVVTAAYSPSDLGQDQCRLDLIAEGEGNDVTVPMNGEGVDRLPTDLDLRSFTARSRVSLSRGGIVYMEVTVKNVGTGTAPGTLTISGQQGSNQFVHQVVQVSDRLARGATKVKLQPYIPVATGEIHWTAVLQDGDPDTDEAEATTLVVR